MSNVNGAVQNVDPVAFIKLVWPDIKLYDKQREILYSVRDNDETIAPAGNMLGKDFISALICLWFFCSRRPARVVTSSVKAEQLDDVLWGEMRMLMETAKVKLPIQYNHMKIRQIRNDKTFVPKAELVGQVVKKGESLLGRHLPNDIPRTLVLFDEASGIADEVYNSATTWAHRILIIGNCFPTDNFFYKAVKEGDIPRPDGDGYYRKIIHIAGEDSPNVKLGMKEKAMGKKPSNRILVPGLLSYKEYVKRRTTFDKMMQCISIDGRFYEGEEVKLFPEEWLKYCWKLWLALDDWCAASSMGVDTAEGGDDSCWAIAGKKKFIKLYTESTPDTSVIPNRTLDLIREHSIDPENVWFDTGGGGKEHADFLRSMNCQVNAMFFGAPATDQTSFIKQFKTQEDKVDAEETRFTYKNKRAELYHKASQMLNPAYGGYPIPPPSYGPQYEELYRQLRAMPKLVDKEGRFYLPPKRKTAGVRKNKEKSLEEILGCSPDEADAFVLSLWGLDNEPETILL